MGVRQLTLDIYNVDQEATREGVEKSLMQAREYKITEYIPSEPVTTASWSDMPRSYTGVTSNPTSDLAIKTVDEMERRKSHVERVEKAISRLGMRQQKLIRARYMVDDDVWDHEVAIEIGFSDRHYRRMKTIAIYRLALILGLLVLND